MKFTKKIGKRRKSRFVTSTSAWASSAIGSLDHGGRIVGVTNGRFSMIDIVRHVLSETGPADLVVATWVVSLESAADLDKMRSTGIATSVRLLVECTPPSRGHQMPAVLEIFGERLIMAKTHAKFAIITNGEWSVTIQASANLNRNRRLEQFDITDDEEIAEFFLGVVERAAKHSTRDQQHARDVLDLVVPGESMDLEDILEGW